MVFLKIEILKMQFLKDVVQTVDIRTVIGIGMVSLSCIELVGKLHFREKKSLLVTSCSGLG